MRRVRYSVAMSLDGYIAGPKGEADWIIMDPDIDLAGYLISSIRSSWERNGLSSRCTRKEGQDRRREDILLLAHTAQQDYPA